MLWVILAIYGLIGIGLVIFGPAKSRIARDIDDARGARIADEISGRAKVPGGRLIALRVILSLGFVLLWPLFLVSILKDSSGKTSRLDDVDSQMEEGLRYFQTNGIGTIRCGDCGFSERITSFIHGIGIDGEEGSITGYQCLNCGKFMTSNGHSKSPQCCECGGVPSRRHVLFCPKCRSRNMTYHCLEMT